MNKLHPGAKWEFRLKGYFFIFLFLIFEIIAVAAGFFLPLDQPLPPMEDPTEFDEALMWQHIFNFARHPITILLTIIPGVLLSELFAVLSYKNFSYCVEKNYFKIEKGIIWKKQVSIPFNKIQNVDVKRGILARLFGFSVIDIHTTGYSPKFSFWQGTSSNDVEGHLPGVSIEQAEKLQMGLTRKSV